MWDRLNSLYGVDLLDGELDWDFVDELRTWTDLPLLLKGLLTAEDAELAVEHGVDGIVVSNCFQPRSPFP